MPVRDVTRRLHEHEGNARTAALLVAPDELDDLRHGEAVAIGLLAALRLSGKEALRSEVANLFAARGLPLHFEGATASQVFELVRRDKKRRGASVPFVLVQAPGEVTHGHEVGDAELLGAIEELRA